MMRRVIPVLLFTAIAALAVACGSSSANQGPVVKVENNQLQKEDGSKAEDPRKNLTASSVSPWNLGPDGALTVDDMRPMMSDGEGYTEKWEFTAYADPYEVKVKFEVANLGFGDFKGRAVGYIKRQSDGKRWKFSKKKSEGDWSWAKEGPFEVKMGNFKVVGEPGDFRLTGEWDDNAFDLQVSGNHWKPGTGIALFGRDLSQYSKASVQVVQGDATGTVTVDGEQFETNGYVWANHFATNVGIHQLVSNLYKFRDHSQDLLIDLKYYETVPAFNGSPFAFIVVSYKGVVVFEATQLQVQPTQYYEDPEHPGYTATHGVVFSAKNDMGQIRLTFPPGEVRVKDPLAKLPSLEQAVARQVTQPLEFRNETTWRMDLLVDGIAATVEDGGSVTHVILK